jgi:selenide,water dikinase
MQNSVTVPQTDPTRLVLVGAGHAHLNVALMLISLDDYHHYSGMVPGYLQGTYTEEAITVDLAGLAERAGGRFLKAKATGLDPQAQTIQLEDTSPVEYDLVSFNLGSQAAGADAETVKQHAVLVKPFSQATHLRQRIQTFAQEKKERVCHVSVVGGGAAGFEVSCTLDAVLDQAGQRHHVSLFEASQNILAGYSDGFRSQAEQILNRKGIAICTGQRVSGVHSDTVEVEKGSPVPSDLTVWLSGAAASSVFHHSGLSVDDRGFLLVNEALHSIDAPRVFGVGDCSTLAAYPHTPKAGVYAVRQGPVLWESLTAVLNGKSLPQYEP